MAVRDPSTEWLRIQIYRGMTPQRRMQLALDLMDMAQGITLSGIRATHPDLNAVELQRELRRRMTPRELRKRVENYPVSEVKSMTREEIVLHVIRLMEWLDIPYMVVGSFAVTVWGEPRTTHDADIVAAMPVEAATEFARALQGEFYADDESMRSAIFKRSMFNVIHLNTGFKVDVWILNDDPYRREAFQRRQRVRLFESSDAEVFVAAAEDIILSKLLWYRESQSKRDFNDVMGVYLIQLPMLDHQFLETWVEQLGLTQLYEQLKQEAERYTPPTQ